MSENIFFYYSISLLSRPKRVGNNGQSRARVRIYHHRITNLQSLLYAPVVLIGLLDVPTARYKVWFLGRVFFYFLLYLYLKINNK